MESDTSETPSPNPTLFPVINKHARSVPDLLCAGTPNGPLSYPAFSFCHRATAVSGRRVAHAERKFVGCDQKRCAVWIFGWNGFGMIRGVRVDMGRGVGGMVVDEAFKGKSELVWVVHSLQQG